MRFTVAPCGTALPPTPARPRPALAPLGKFWRGWTSPGIYEVVLATTPDGGWLFVLAPGGTWTAICLPAWTEVKCGLGSLRACRAYVASGKAGEDLGRIAAERKGAA